MCCEGGILLFTLYDQRVSSSLLFVVWIEIVVVMGFYGINKFIDNVQEMGMKLGLSRPFGPLRVLIIILLGIVTPGVLIAVAVIGWIKREPISYGGVNFPEIEFRVCVCSANCLLIPPNIQTIGGEIIISLFSFPFPPSAAAIRTSIFTILHIDF